MEVMTTTLLMLPRESSCPPATPKTRTLISVAKRKNLSSTHRSLSIMSPADEAPTPNIMLARHLDTLTMVLAQTSR